MRRRALRGWIAAALMLSASGTVWAQGDADYARPGAYVGLGFSYGKESFDVSSVESSLSRDISAPAQNAGCNPATAVCELHVLVDRTDSLGGDLRGGYRFNRWVAAELDLQYYDNYDLKLGGAAQDFADIRTFGFFGQGKFYPVDGVLQPYVLGGIGGLYANVKTRDKTITRELPGMSQTFTGTASVFAGENDEVVFAGRFGGGLDYYITRHLVLNFDISYTLTTDYSADGLPDDISLDYIPITLGLQYRL